MECVYLRYAVIDVFEQEDSPISGHRHGNWVFERSGLYQLLGQSVTIRRLPGQAAFSSNGRGKYDALVSCPAWIQIPFIGIELPQGRTAVEIVDPNHVLGIVHCDLFCIR